MWKFKQLLIDGKDDYHNSYPAIATLQKNDLCKNEKNVKGHGKAIKP